jgi:hypothetical protein
VVNIALTVTGAIILVFVYSDFIYTSLSTSGSGFLSKRVTLIIEHDFIRPAARPLDVPAVDRLC